MKIFHTENGKEVVYVQIQDIVELNQSDMPIPASIYLNAFNGIVFVDDSNRFDFVEHEVKFFKELDFIVDYDKYKDLTDEQLEGEWKKLVKNQISQTIPKKKSFFEKIFFWKK